MLNAIELILHACKNHIYNNVFHEMIRLYLLFFTQFIIILRKLHSEARCWILTLVLREPHMARTVCRHLLRLDSTVTMVLCPREIMSRAASSLMFFVGSPAPSAPASAWGGQTNKCVFDKKIDTIMNDLCG